MELYSNRKPNKIWVDKSSEFYNSSFKKWSENNNIEMYSTHNQGKSVVPESCCNVRRVTFSRCPQDVNFEHKYKMHFCGNIFSFSSPNMCIKY